MTVDAPVMEPPRWLGGPSAFGLALPDASPTPSTMYAPRGVCLTDDVLIASDTGNHRLLVWHGGVPDADHAEADVVIGHADMTTEGPELFFLPTGVMVLPDGRLVVADAWHHRLLVWNEVPRTSGAMPDVVLGQTSLEGVTEGCGSQEFYWPFGMALTDGVFWVADTGNRRALGWLGGLPDPGQPADLVLGQSDLTSRGENRDGPVAANSFRWPHAVTSVGDTLFVADAGNHRVLGWNGQPGNGEAAQIVIGQSSFDTAIEYPYRPQGPRAFRFPYAITASETTLYVADTSNNRVAVIDDAAATFAAEPLGGAFDRVLGQPDLDANGENRWDSVQHDTLCWPYGLSYHGGRLAIADSGNNRVVVWGVGE